MWQTNVKRDFHYLYLKCQELGLNPFTVFGADVTRIIDVLNLNDVRVTNHLHTDTRYFALHENAGKWHLAWFDMKGQSERDYAQALITEREIAPMTAADDTPRDAVLMAMRWFEDTPENAEVRSWLYRLSVDYYERPFSPLTVSVRPSRIGGGSLSINLITERLLAAGLSRETILTHLMRDIYDAPDLFMMMGREVLDARDFGDYQGFWVIVYRYEGLYHITVYDYGTCSGCDEIMGLCSDRDTQGLIQLVERSIGYTGDTLSDAVNAMKRDGWASSWYIDPYRIEIIDWLQAMKV